MGPVAVSVVRVRITRDEAFAVDHAGDWLAELIQVRNEVNSAVHNSYADARAIPSISPRKVGIRGRSDVIERPADRAVRGDVNDIGVFFELRKQASWHVVNAALDRLKRPNMEPALAADLLVLLSGGDALKLSRQSGSMRPSNSSSRARAAGISAPAAPAQH